MKMKLSFNQSALWKTRLTRIVGALAAVAAIASSHAQSVFNDNLDGYANQTAFTGVWQTTATGTELTLSTVQEHSSPQSIVQGAAAAISAAPMSAHVNSDVLYFRCWFYDSSGSSRSWAAPEAYNNDTTYAGASLLQALGIGRYNSIDSAHYYGREANGTAGGTSEGASAFNSGWFTLAISISTGWHKFEIVGLRQADLSIKYRYYVDGALGGACVDAGGVRQFNWVRCGSGLSNGSGSNYYDDMVVEALTMTPQINTDPAPLTVSELQPASFAVGASAGGTPNTYALNTLKYQWQFNDADISGATTSSYSIASASVSANEGNYRCIVTDAYGRVPATSAEAYLTVNPIQSPVIDSQTGGGVVNVGSSTTFTVTAHGDQPMTYTWKQNGTQVATGTDNFYAINSVVAGNAGTYTCVVRNDASPDATSAPMILTVNNLPGLTTPSSLSVGIGGTYTYRLRASSTPALSSEATLFEDFESAANGGLVMFDQPSFSGSTSGNLDLTAGHNNFSMVTNQFPAGHSGTHVLKSSWTWNASGAGALRLVTAIATGMTLTNPIISFSGKLQLDIFCDQNLEVALGARETSPTGAIGTSDTQTQSATIERIGMSGGVPTKTVTANTWTTLDFDPLTDPIQAYTGNGVLDSTTGKGVLEHLWFVNTGTLPNDNNVYLDNFAVVYTNGFTFSLTSGPAGATIDQYTGLINWTPTALGPQDFTVLVTDAYGLSTSTTFNVTAMPSPATIDSISAPNSFGDVTITGHGAALQSFRLKSSTDLSLPVASWTQEDTDTTKTGSFSWTVLGPTDAQKYFIVESYGD